MDPYSLSVKQWRAVSLAESSYESLLSECTSGANLVSYTGIENGSQMYGRGGMSDEQIIKQALISSNSASNGAESDERGLLSALFGNLIDLFSEEHSKLEEQQHFHQYTSNDQHQNQAKQQLSSSAAAAAVVSSLTNSILQQANHIQHNFNSTTVVQEVLGGSLQSASEFMDVDVANSQFDNSRVATAVVVGEGQGGAGAGVGGGDVRVPEGNISDSVGAKVIPVVDNPLQLEALGERWQIFLIVLYSLTAITSFVLNVITVIVLARCRGSELRKYLINLSMSDLLMSLLSIPFTYTEYMLGRWIFFGSLCPVVRFVVTLSVFVSAATMTVIGMNRHLAIMDPFGRRDVRTFQRWLSSKERVIGAIWLLGIAISMPEYLTNKTEPFCYNRQLYYYCRHTWPESIYLTSRFYTICIFLCTFAIPLSLLSYLYLQLGLKLWRQKVPGNVHANRDIAIHVKRVKSIKMLFVVVIMFAVSWLPLQTFTLLINVMPQLRADFEYQKISYYVFVGSYFTFHWLSMFHSCLNPLIYCFMNDKFRFNLQALLFGRRRLLISTTAQKHITNDHNHIRLALLARTLDSNHTRVQSIVDVDGMENFSRKQIHDGADVDSELKLTALEEKRAEEEEDELELKLESRAFIGPVQV